MNTLEDDITDRQRAVLAVIRAADKPLKHCEIAERIAEPWYVDRHPSSFRASVASCLGVLRTKGYVRQRQIETGRTVYIPSLGRVAEKKVHWVARPSPTHTAGPVGKIEPMFPPSTLSLIPFEQRVLDRIGASMGLTFEQMSADLGSVAYSRAKEYALRQREFTVTQDRLVETGRRYREPVTDDMRTMIDDLNRGRGNASSSVQSLLAGRPGASAACDETELRRRHVACFARLVIQHKVDYKRTQLNGDFLMLGFGKKLYSKGGIVGAIVSHPADELAAALASNPTKIDWGLAEKKPYLAEDVRDALNADEGDIAASTPASIAPHLPNLEATVADALAGTQVVEPVTIIGRYQGIFGRSIELLRDSERLLVAEVEHKSEQLRQTRIAIEAAETAAQVLAAAPAEALDHSAAVEAVEVSRAALAEAKVRRVVDRAAPNRKPAGRKAVLQPGEKLQLRGPLAAEGLSDGAHSG